MSVYGLVSSLRKLVVVNLPATLMPPAGWLRAGIAVSLACYVAAKIYGVIFGPLALLELLLLPAGCCALALVLAPAGLSAASSPADALQDDWSNVRTRRLGLAGAAVLLVFTTTLVVLNTVPLVTSEDESAIINGGYQVAREGSLRIQNDLNDTYHTNIIGGLYAVNKTATDRYYGVFPGSALLYAPFSFLPSDAAYRVYTALFASIVAVALYAVAWKLLRSWPAALIATLVFVASPAFGHWSVTVFNNIPVLAMELIALAFVVLPGRLKPRHLAFAGGLMGLALFVRITELAFVLPLLALVWWRTRAWKDCLPLLAGTMAGGLLVLITNELFFGSAFFLPHVGTPYISLNTPAPAHQSQSLLERYFLFAIGTSGSPSNFEPMDKVHNVWFHVRYLGSSTFAFPFLPLSFAGLALMVAAGRRHGWLLLSGIVSTAGLIILIYGQQHSNYYGFGLRIVRSSFVRYSLPVYALLAIPAGGFFLELGRIFRAHGRTGLLLFAVVVLLLAWIGVGQSYDRDVYGFNRLNAARERDRNAWNEIDMLLRDQDHNVLLVVDEYAMKMVPNNQYPDTINYSRIPPASWGADLLPVISASAANSDVYLLMSEIQPESQLARQRFSEKFYLQKELRYAPWVLYQIEPPIFEAVCASCR